MSDERVTHLELHVADLERTISELNDVLTEQWKAVDSLRRENAAIAHRLVRLEQSKGYDVPPTGHF